MKNDIVALKGSGMSMYLKKELVNSMDATNILIFDAEKEYKELSENNGVIALKGSGMSMYQKEVIKNDLIVGGGRSGMSMSHLHDILSSDGGQAMNNKIEGVKGMQYDNSVVGFVNNIAIVKDDNCELYFTEVPAEHIAIGDFILEADLRSLSELDAETRKNIEEKFA